MKNDIKEEKSKSSNSIESILDLNSNNVWSVDEYFIRDLWEKEREEDDFSISEDKLLNIIRLAFEVVHYNADDERDKKRYENDEWVVFSHCNPEKGNVAIRRKTIKRITDISYENVRHISAPVLLDLIDKNFGGGWDSLSLQIRDIIESGFDVSTTQLPASRIHAPGGTVEKKVAQGYDVLEVAKGTWIEAIFAKKKDPVEKLRFEGNSSKYGDEDGDLDDETDEKEYDTEDQMEDEDDVMEENDETFYSSYAPEAEVKDEDNEGFPSED